MDSGNPGPGHCHCIEYDYLRLDFSWDISPNKQYSLSSTTEKYLDQLDSEGKTVGTSQIGYDIIKEKLQYAEQDMEKLWEATKETITDLVKRYPEESAKIHGISYSGQMHGLVMIGADGKLIRNAIIWADQRSEKEIQKIYDITGKDTYRGTVLNSLSTGFLISSLMWVKEHEAENFEKIRYVVFPKVLYPL